MRLVAVLAIIVAGAAVPAARQAREGQRTPQFRTGIEVVEVDVSVLDDRRRPVRGLTAADFTILEDGRPQEVVSFSAIDVAPPERVPAGWLRDIAPDVRSNLASADRLIVMVLDDAQVRFGPRHTQSVKEAALRVIDRLGSDDLAAVVFTRDNEGAQPFTSDRQRLIRAVEAFHGGFGGGGGGTRADADSLHYFYMSSLKTLRYVAESLYDASPRRKSVIYISPGVPIEGSDLDAFSRRQEAERIIEDARRANVNVYAMDPSGLGGLDGEDTPQTAGRQQRLANDFLHALANGTGGRALVNRNTFADGINEVFDENASYYLVGYRSSNSDSRARLRKIDVRVNRPGLTVRARTGYGSARAEKASKDGVSPALVKTLRDAAPRGDVAMQMTAAPFAVSGEKKAAVAMAIALRQPRIAAEGPQVERVSLLIGAYAPDGKLGAFERMTARVVLRSGAGEPFVRYELVTGISMAPGRYQIRVAAESALHAREGSLHYDVTVPDFSKGDLNLSGVVMTVEPNVAVAGAERVDKIVPVVPTSRREFWEHDRVSAFMRIYQGDRAQEPVTVRVRLQNAQERTVFEKTDVVATTRLAAIRAADYRLALPTAGLAPGPYLLTIDAAAGRASVRRDVRIIRR